MVGTFWDVSVQCEYRTPMISVLELTIPATWPCLNDLDVLQIVTQCPGDAVRVSTAVQHVLRRNIYPQKVVPKSIPTTMFGTLVGDMTITPSFAQLNCLISTKVTPRGKNEQQGTDVNMDDPRHGLPPPTPIQRRRSDGGIISPSLSLDT